MYIIQIVIIFEKNLYWDNITGHKEDSKRETSMAFGIGKTNNVQKLACYTFIFGINMPL